MLIFHISWYAKKKNNKKNLNQINIWKWKDINSFGTLLLYYMGKDMGIL